MRNEAGVILTRSVAKGKDLLFSCTLGNIRDAVHVFRGRQTPIRRPRRRAICRAVARISLAPTLVPGTWLTPTTLSSRASLEKHLHEPSVARVSRPAGPACVPEEQEADLGLPVAAQPVDLPHQQARAGPAVDSGSGEPRYARSPTRLSCKARNLPRRSNGKTEKNLPPPERNGTTLSLH